jgi:N-acyl-phosphatidylethanolamine-hydrolysing phospholipase D
LNSITFINHATVLIRIGSANFLTDPVYTNTVSYILPHLKPAGVPFHHLPPIDGVLISHNHYDHLNLKTLRRLSEKKPPMIVVTRGNVKYARRAGFTNIVELNWWERCKYNGIVITCVPAKHTSGRGAFDMNKTVYGGYVLESTQHTVYFAGDTAYDGFFKILAEKFSIDAALLPIGAYRPRSWFKHIHMCPEEAVKAFLDLKARYLIPIHWGTFKISDEPMDEPPRLILEESQRMNISDRLFLLDNGRVFFFPDPHPGN